MQANLLQQLPYEHRPLTPQTRSWRHWGYILVAILLIVPAIKFEIDTLRTLRKVEQARLRGEERDKTWRGAIGRWARDIEAFWAGENIYLPPPMPGQTDTRERAGWPALHPNMPAVVVALTPFVLMPPAITALVFAFTKMIVWMAAILLALRVATHDERRLSAGVALLIFVAAWDFYLSDQSHGNTNVFTALAIVLHLWLFRRGKDVLAGVALAAAICLKMTPALFLVYWLYQRQWKVFLSAAMALPLLVLSPVLLLGWERTWQDLMAWWQHIIYPATFGGHWWPTHNNQSLPGMIARLFIDGPFGNYMWDADLSPYDQPEVKHIVLVDLGPGGARRLLQAIQLIMLAAMAWTIGWRKLPREDGRRGLHYGMICAAMLLFSQRTWDHHATHLLMAHAAIGYAVFRSQLSDQFKTITGWIFVFSIFVVYATSGDVLKGLFDDEGADFISAWGTTFWHFVLIWGLCLVFAVRLRRLRDPYMISAHVTPSLIDEHPSARETAAVAQA